MSTKQKSLLVLLVLALAITVIAKDKPWTEWTVKDAQKILNNSGWGQTQTYMSSEDTTSTLSSASTSASTASSRGGASSGQGQSGIKGGLVDAIPGVNYRIRFLSAKPIRQALLRLAQLDPKATPEEVEKAHQLVDSKYDKVVVIAVSFDQDGLPKDNRYTMPVFQAFSGGLTDMLKTKVFLDIKGGQRVFLQEYKPPSGQGMDAVFIFPRIVNDKPILDPKSGEVRFYAEFPKLGGTSDPQVRLNMRFKVSDLMYDGVLEF
jgi:hypothetical protein